MSAGEPAGVMGHEHAEAAADATLYSHTAVGADSTRAGLLPNGLASVIGKDRRW